MLIRRLGNPEILPALRLAWEVFVQDVAPGYVPEGVEAFRDFIKYETINPKFLKGELVFFGAFEGDRLCGMSALQSRGHISLLFVKKEYQHQGIGGMLFQAMRRYCVKALGVPHISVNAAPNAAEIYRHFGMHPVGPSQNTNGIQFVPMEMDLSYESRQVHNQKDRKILLAVAIAVSFLVMLLFVGWWVYKEIKYTIWENHSYEDNYDHYNDGDPYDDWGRYFYDDGSGYSLPEDGDAEEEPELTGLEAIEEYRSQNAEYEIKEETYTYTDGETKNTTIQFEVTYPQIDGIEKEVQDKVNASLEQCAMETVDKIYLNPSQEMKEKVLGEENPVLASFVRYKVTYIGETCISVVFEDYSYEGSSEDYKLSLRTRNISLENGKVFEVKDIVDLDEEFLEKWIQVMREEAGDETLLSELSTKEMKEVLSGEEKEGVYQDNFFLDADGIEIGLGLNYPQGTDSRIGNGWVTAPFDMEEIALYKTDSDFWKYIE